MDQKNKIILRLFMTLIMPSNVRLCAVKLIIVSVIYNLKHKQSHNNSCIHVFLVNLTVFHELLSLQLPFSDNNASIYTLFIKNIFFFKSLPLQGRVQLKCEQILILPRNAKTLLAVCIHVWRHPQVVYSEVCSTHDPQGLGA